MAPKLAATSVAPKGGSREGWKVSNSAMTTALLLADSKAVWLVSMWGVGLVVLKAARLAETLVALKVASKGILWGGSVVEMMAGM